MIAEYNIAGNIVYSIKESVSFELFDDIKRTGNYVFSKYSEIYKKTKFSYFRTPYEMDPKSIGPGYQYETENAKLQKHYSALLTNLCREVTGSEYKVTDLWYLYQPEEPWVNNPPHKHLTADLVASMYVQVEQGDSIIFFDIDSQPEHYFVTSGEILIFHSDVIHKPGETVGGSRLSINAELNLV